jgi:hypothetical protein
MSAASIGKLLAGAVSVPSTEAQVRLWRRTYNVDDRRADVGRKLGDGTERQGKIVLATIVEAAKAWFDTENKEARAAYVDAQRARADAQPGAPAPKKRRVLKWNLLNTLGAVLNFVDFKTGDCIATYEMIAAAANICRDTVYKHLNILRDLGLIDWVRRCEPTGNKVGQKVKAAPNAYFFEITRLPSRVQMLIRQILSRRGVKLEAHPDRVGSGVVPNRAQRIACRVGKGLSQAKQLFTNRKHRDAQLAEAAFINAETALMGDIPTSQWATIRHPDDAVAQHAYNARLGIHSFPHESLEKPLQSPPTERREKD